MDKKEKEQNDQEWARVLFAERCRVLEFYGATMIALLAGVWFLWKDKLCDESHEKILIVLTVLLIHFLFFALFGIINKRLQNKQKSLPNCCSTEIEFGQKDIKWIGFICMSVGLVILLIFVIFAPDCQPCTECTKKPKSSLESTLEQKEFLAQNQMYALYQTRDTQ